MICNIWKRAVPAKLLSTGISLAILFAAIPSVACAQATEATAAPGTLTISPLQQLAQMAALEGITFNSQYVGEFAANPSGGAHSGSAYTGQLSIGSDVDLGKLVGLAGGSVHTNFVERAGNSLAAGPLDNSISVQQVYGAGQTWQMSLLTYEQKFGHIADVAVGRDSLDNSFIGYDFLCDFQSNASCGNTGILGKDTSTAFNPTATWGGHVKLTPTANTYAQLGLYQANPAVNPQNSHGFDWAFSGTGFELPIEAGYVYTTPGATEQNKYDVGAIFDRLHYSAPYYNEQSPGQYGRTLIYAQAQQMVYQTQPDSSRGLYLFGIGMYSPDGGTQVANFSVEGGALFQGPFASRPDDTVGFMVSELHYNHPFLMSIFDAREEEGGTEFPAANMVMMELNYGAQVNRWLNVMLNFQYIVNPDGLGGTSIPVRNEKSSAVIGLQFTADLGKLLGLP